MKTIGEDVGRRVMALIVACVIVSLVTAAFAQDVTITNPDQLAQVALSANYSIELPFSPWDWRAFPTDWPLWCDFTQMGCLDSLPTSTNFMTSMDWSNVPLASVILTKNVLSGVTTVQSADSTDVVATIAAPTGYQPGVASEDRWLWNWYVQTTNNPDSWGLTAGQIPSPIVTLQTFLADSNAYYSVYESNLEAEAEAAAVAQASSTPTFAMGRGFMSMDDDDDGGGAPCTITNESAPFSVVSLAPDGSGNMVLSWQSCTDHIYVVQSESSLTPTSSWTDVAWMFGTDQQTSWTDTNAVGLTQDFYQVVRLNPNALNNGIPYWWAVTYGLDPLDPNLAYEDSDNSFWSNLADYENGVDPTDRADAPPLTFMIDGGTNPVASTQLDIQLASGIIADYVVIGEDLPFTNSVTNAFSSSFEYTLMSNVDGFHTVYLQLLNTNGIASALFAATVQVEQGAPTIWISSPTNGTVTGQRQIDVQGFAGDANTNGSAPLQVTVNGDFVNDRDTNGNWWSAQDLTPGTNTFLAVATGLAGFATTSSVSIVYDPTLATNVPNFTLDVTNTVTVGSNTATIAVSGSIDDSNATVQITVLNASDNTVTDATASAAVLGTNWWGNVPVAAGSSIVVVSAQNSASAPATNSFALIQNTNVFLEIESPAPDIDVNATNVLVVGLASTNFDQTITINGQPALTSTGPDGITFSNSVSINNIDANIVEVEASGSDGSSATTRETVYGYGVEAFHFHYHGAMVFPDTDWCTGDQFDDWDPTDGNTYQSQLKACIPEIDFDWPCGFVCGSPNNGDVCLPLAALEGDFSYGIDTGSWDSQLTAIKHSPVDEEQMVVFHFTSFQYKLYCTDPMGFDPSQITFRGAQGFWYVQNGQTNGVAFLIKVRTNTPFTIQASDFQFPAKAENCVEFKLSGSSHLIQFAGFGNGKVDIIGPTNLYVYCNASAVSGTFYVTNAPPESSVSWSVTTGGDKVQINSTTGVATPTDANHASSNVNDVVISATVTVPGGQPMTLTKNITVRKPWAFGAPRIDKGHATEGIPVNLDVYYAVRDQLCAIFPPQLIAGTPVTESFPNGNAGSAVDNFIRADGTAHDAIAIPATKGDNGAITYLQVLTADCATVTNNITTDPLDNWATITQTGPCH